MLREVTSSGHVIFTEPIRMLVTEVQVQNNGAILAVHRLYCLVKYEPVGKEIWVTRRDVINSLDLL